MKLKLLSALFALFVLSSGAIAQDLKTTNDSLSYAIGVDIASSFKKQNININMDVFVKALNETKQNKGVLSAEDASNFIRNYFTGQTQKVANDNMATGKAFLMKNKSVAGVTELPSGLQYQIMVPGTGPMPTREDRVKVHYKGYKIDGEVFDSSYDRGEPAVFGLTQVINGWTEGLQLMPTGSKWKFFIPENLAYGQQAPPAIGPNEVLIFEIELLEIVKQ